jgi:hypothetical protein
MVGKKTKCSGLGATGREFTFRLRNEFAAEIEGTPASSNAA